MTEEKEKTRITQNQFWQLYGLLSAKIILNQKIDLIFESFKEIVGKDNEDYFWEFSESHELTDFEPSSVGCSILKEVK